MHFDLRDTEAASFLGSSRFTSVNGPCGLVRFTDASRGHEAACGNLDRRCGIHRSYWLYADDILDLLDEVSGPGPYGLKIIREVSERWAICDDWGDLHRAWVMNIPQNEKIDGYCGFAKFQPRTSTAEQRRSGKTSEGSYPGSRMQFVLGLTDKERHWIQGPLPTLSLSLSRKKLSALRSPRRA